MEQTFTDNLNQREQVAARRSYRPQFAGRLMEREVHLSDFIIPVGISWAGKTLAQLNLGRRFGVHVVSVLRGQNRINIPSGMTTILPGDRLQVIGSDEQISIFSHALEEESAAANALEAVGAEMKLRRLIISPDSPVAGKTIQESGIRKDYRCLIVGLEGHDNNGLISPDPKTLLHAGDIIWLVGEEADLAALEGAKNNTL